MRTLASSVACRCSVGGILEAGGEVRCGGDAMCCGGEEVGRAVIGALRVYEPW